MFQILTLFVVFSFVMLSKTVQIGESVSLSSTCSPALRSMLPGSPWASSVDKGWFSFNFEGRALICGKWSRSSQFCPLRSCSPWVLVTRWWLCFVHECHRSVPLVSECHVALHSGFCFTRHARHMAALFPISLSGFSICCACSDSHRYVPALGNLMK